MPIVSARKTYAERIAESDWYVNPAGCWIWRGEYQGARAKLRTNTGQVNAARAMWIAAYGEPHDLLEVSHACHNSRCVNIDHLYLANHVRNMADTVTGKFPLPFSVLPIPAQRPRERVVLTENDVQRVRRLHTSRLLNTRELAKLFDVTDGAIRKALTPARVSESAT